MNRHNVDDATDTNKARLRPLWMRALGLALIWLMVLQPTVATAAIAQRAPVLGQRPAAERDADDG